MPAKSHPKASSKAPSKGASQAPSRSAAPRKRSAAQSAGRVPAGPDAPVRLGKDDWLQVAFQSVVEGGFDKVRVLLLADRLQVTRGSFYWHFADHAELLEALYARWRQQEEETRARLMAIESDDPRADLVGVLGAALAHAGPDLENMRFELALRGVGRRDPAVAAMLADADQQRMALFEHRFRRLTRDRRKAAELAALFYLAIAGSYQALSRPGTDEAFKAGLIALISDYLVDAQRDA